jgi:hypothetical protein
MKTQGGLIYQKDGKQFVKIARNEKIRSGAMHSWCGGELQPIMHDETIGQTPDDFSDEREFFNPWNPYSYKEQ